jgi:hypothetical protein
MQIWRDLVFGVRAFRRTPGFTVVTVLTLALGIGATTAIFSVVQAVLLRPLSYRDPERRLLFGIGKYGRRACPSCSILTRISKITSGIAEASIGLRRRRGLRDLKS